MEEDDDDLYDPTDVAPSGSAAQNTEQQSGDAGMTEGQGHEQVEEEEEEEEEEDDEDDFKIITEAPPEVAAELTTQTSRHPAHRNEPQKPATDPASATPKGAALHPTPKPGTPTVTPAATTKSAAPQKPGSSYPAHHTSTIDVSANPVHPSTNKPILSTDLDSDFPTEDDKPWRRPGSDINDYFNYGFDEFTWASYCLKQQSLRKDINDQKSQMEDMQAFLSLPGGLPGMPVPGGPAPPLPGLIPGAVAGGEGAEGVEEQEVEVLLALLKEELGQDHRMLCRGCLLGCQISPQT
ncbi:Pre-mRNA polyadenylation factor Fip1 [Trichophyton rubrum]|nr:Pre-mRNA polyadenylation factor Fip1 [Trichophyton rubrum]